MSIILFGGGPKRKRPALMTLPEPETQPREAAIPLWAMMARFSLHAAWRVLRVVRMPIESEPTIVPGIVLSDLAIVEAGTQKRTLVGCFDQFAFPQFPAAYARFFVTVWVTNVEGKLSEIDLTTRIEQKGSAHVVFSSSAKLPLGGEKNFERNQLMTFSVPVPGLTFPTHGAYTVIILLNGDEVGRRDINVLQIATQI
jgi:hypothetical protein